MKQKQKIIILTYLTSLGLTILLIPFFNKGNSLPKNNYQYLINNQYSPKKKKNKALIFLTISILFGIIIIILIIFWISKKIKKSPIKKIKPLKDLHPKPDFQKFLSGKLYVQCDLKLPNIKIFFSPFQQSPEAFKLSETLYDLDINIISKEMSQKIKKIYQELQTPENTTSLKKFSQLITDLFDLIDGHLLETIHSYRTENKIRNKLTITKNYFLKIKKAYLSSNKPIEVDSETVYSNSAEYTKEIFITENDEPMKLFKTIINDEKAAYYKNAEDKKRFPFANHYTLYNDLVKIVMGELDFFFQQTKNKKIKKIKEKYQKIKSEIEQFLEISQPKTVN